MGTRAKIAFVITLVVMAIGAGAWWWKAQRDGIGESAELAAKAQGFQVEIYRPGWFGEDELVYDIVGIDNAARRVDAIHAFVAAAERLQDQQFFHVVLANEGKRRFKLAGPYVRRLGKERSFQNSVYTVRTFPQNVQRMDGTRPWPEVRGGLLGVVRAEMENVNPFLDEWLR